jgi:gliding motility-associated-like protein
MKMFATLMMIFALNASGQTILNKELCDETVHIELSVVGSVGNLVYDWFTDFDGDISENENGISFWISQTGAYQVSYKATDSNGCEAFGEASIIIEECPFWSIYFPNTFTPNGDGDNDTWFPLYENVFIESIEIWNRWGERIYSGNNPWDGSYLSVMVQEDVYVGRVFYIANNQKLQKTVSVSVLF